MFESCDTGTGRAHIVCVLIYLPEFKPIYLLEDTYYCYIQIY